MLVLFIYSKLLDTGCNKEKLEESAALLDVDKSRGKGEDGVAMVSITLSNSGQAYSRLRDLKPQFVKCTQIH